MAVFRRISVIVTALLLVSAPAMGAEEEIKKPKLQIESPVFDFGTVAQGTVVAQEFKIANLGNANLTINRLVPSCGCTASSASQDSIAPGESGAIKVEFDTTGFSGDKLKSVRVYTNDMDNPTAMLTVKGVVESEVQVEPKRIDFGDLVRGGRAAQVVTVKIAESSAVAISGVRSYSPAVQVVEKASTSKSKTYEISLSPDAPLGELRDRVVINLRGGKSSTVNIPVFASVQGTLRVRPATVSFGIIEGSSPLTRSVKFDNLSASPITIQELRTNDPAVKAVAKSIKQGRSFVVDITVDPTKVKRDLRAVVEIVTSNDSERAVSLSVFGVLPPKVPTATKQG